jgi:hypothetical protein
MPLSQAADRVERDQGAAACFSARLRSLLEYASVGHLGLVAGSIADQGPHVRAPRAAE